MSLDQLRNRLTIVDKELIELISERQKIVSEVSAYKIKTGIAIRDYGRESKILKSVEKQSISLGLDPTLAKEIMKLLISASLQQQEKSKVSANSDGEGKRALIIGGAGKMGFWMADFLNSQNFLVEIADNSNTETIYPKIDWLNDNIEHDVIVVATPIKSTVNVLTTLAKKKPKGLIFDIGSLKTPLKQGINDLIDSGCKATSIHPMFGPDTQLLSGRHIIFVDLGNDAATKEAKKIFSSTMVEKVSMSLDQHDQAISYILGLSHAINIIFFTALANSDEKIKNLIKISSTTFDSQLNVASSVAQESPDLYYEIQALNKYTSLSLDSLISSANNLKELINSKNKDGFIEMMEIGRNYLSSK
ncbi:MAG: bifunctional chorismate mutase/prephenate dehydrogenase [Pseudomonadota bacterium]|nr:hypothetical protein [Gammaproteobacteria bacterium]MEE2684378.1 bifunctional chorismate mutase/prephenate dehydrogenase [Pseudomonadota bacterium]|tara:strand:- start:5249 stop:6331 length:1083 start_codon:yes stop_codon:yes gene_type:complete